jgi:hypothetical protein
MQLLQESYDESTEDRQAESLVAAEPETCDVLEPERYDVLVKGYHMAGVVGSAARLDCI